MYKSKNQMLKTPSFTTFRLNSLAINSPLNIWIQQSSHDRNHQGNHDCRSMFASDPTPFSMPFSKENMEHFHEQRKSTANINTPDVIEIDEEIYNKLYPKDMKIIPKRIRLEYQSPTNKGDEPIDYDVDLEDQHWLQKNEKISPEKFEEVIEFLEKKSLFKVSSLEELRAHEIVDKLESEEIYDYWLDKRLRTKQKMLFDIKRACESKKLSRKLAQRNPYIVFHQMNDRIHTRKNRLRDKENYLEMLNHRVDLAQCHSFFKSKADLAKTQRDELAVKFQTFQSLVQAQKFSFNLYTEAREDPKELVQDLEKIDLQPINHDSEFADQDPMPLKDSKYWAPRNSESELGWAAPKNEGSHTTYYKVPTGLMRKRLGRGGRIIFDRRTTKIPKGVNDYKLYNMVNCIVKCKKISDPFKYSTTSTSRFSITNSFNKCKNCTTDESFLMEEY